MPLTDISVEYNEEGKPTFNEYYLGKWSRIIRIRDEKICHCCDNLCPTLFSHAHHIFPKGIYPELAYMLWNGITLCAKCHGRIIHSSGENESSFRLHWWPYMQSNGVTQFNEQWQYKMTDGIWVDQDLMKSLRLSPAWITS